MNWERINRLAEDEARAELSRCCGAARWVAGMLAQRPFSSFAAACAAADRIWWSLEASDWREAFSHHPQIGDIKNLRQKFSATADLSAGEQAGATSAAEEILHALAAANRAYLERFGYIFIVCASGKSAAEMLTILETRLPNPPHVELVIAAEEQRKITHLRLEKWLQAERPLRRHVALIMLENRLGELALQLRDRHPQIELPGHWGLFGGGLEAEETVDTAILREVAEELSVRLPRPPLRYLGGRYFQEGALLRELFWYPVGKQLATAVLREGADWAFVPLDQLAEASHIDGHPVAPSHQRLVAWFRQLRLLEDA